MPGPSAYDGEGGGTIQRVQAERRQLDGAAREGLPHLRVRHASVLRGNTGNRLLEREDVGGFRSSGCEPRTGGQGDDRKAEARHREDAYPKPGEDTHSQMRTSNLRFWLHRVPSTKEPFRRSASTPIAEGVCWTRRGISQLTPGDRPCRE